MSVPAGFTACEVSVTWSVLTCSRCGAQFSFPTAKLSDPAATIGSFLADHRRQPYCSEKKKLTPRA